MDPALIHKQIRDDADDVRAFSLDLNNWRNEMIQTEKLLKENTAENKELPPVRSVSASNQQNCEFSSWDNAPNISSHWVNADNHSQLSNKQLREKSLFEKEQGNKAVCEHRWEHAILNYTEAINCYATDPKFYANRALCFFKLNLLREAETDCTTALQLDNTYVKAYHRRGLIRIKLNQIPEAYDDFRKALKFDPNNEIIKNDMKKYEKLLNGNGINGKDTNGESTRITNKDDVKKEAFLLKEKGNAFVKKQQWDEAVKCYTSAIAKYSDDVFYANRALCFLKLHRPKSAVLDCTKAIELNASNCKAYHRRGLALQILGKFEDARSSFVNALELDPGNCETGRALSKLDEQINVARERKMTKKSVQVNEEKVTAPNYAESENNIQCKYGYTNNFDMPEDIIEKNINEVLETAQNLPEHLRCGKIPFNVKKKKIEKPAEEPNMDLFDIPQADSQTTKEKTDEDSEENKGKPSFVIKYPYFSDSKPFDDDCLKAGFCIVNPLTAREFQKNVKNSRNMVIEHLHKKVQIKINEVENVSDDKCLEAIYRYINTKKDGNGETDSSDLTNFLVDYFKNTEFNESSDILRTTIVELKSPHADAEIETKGSHKEDLCNGFHNSAHMTRNVSDFPVPKTYVQFCDIWKELEMDSHSKYLYLKGIDGYQLPRIFEDLLENSIFSEILQTMSTKFVEYKESVYSYLVGLSRTNRFNFIMMFSTPEDTKNIQQLFAYCECLKECPMEELQKLKTQYSVGV